MYFYEVSWYKENSDSSEKTNLQVLNKSEIKDGGFTVIKIIFGPVSDIEVHDRAVLRIRDGNQIIIMENTIKVHEDKRVDIHQPTGSYKKVSLEKCELRDIELHCEIYWT